MPNDPHKNLKGTGRKDSAQTHLNTSQSSIGVSGNGFPEIESHKFFLVQITWSSSHFSLAGKSEKSPPTFTLHNSALHTETLPLSVIDSPDNGTGESCDTVVYRWAP